MKQFKKWFSKERDDGMTMYPSSYDDCSSAWAAALKCVRDEMLSSGEYEPPMEICAFIKEELDC